MKQVLFVLALSLSKLSFASEAFVKEPDPTLTPGTTCATPDSYRFGARIPYCSRDVDSGTKRMVIAIYDQKLGTRIQQMNREDFKIDHLIPLCIGGSNEMKNLWPQHKSTFVLTDPIEHKTCELVGSGRLSQQQAIGYVRQAKENPHQALQILAKLN